jgi:heme/copper-type cytochrome/quinol oxidase subunit 2
VECGWTSGRAEWDNFASIIWADFNAIFLVLVVVAMVVLIVVLFSIGFELFRGQGADI